MWVFWKGVAEKRYLFIDFNIEENTRIEWDIKKAAYQVEYAAFLFSALK